MLACQRQVARHHTNRDADLYGRVIVTGSQGSLPLLPPYESCDNMLLIVSLDAWKLFLEAKASG